MIQDLRRRIAEDDLVHGRGAAQRRRARRLPRPHRRRCAARAADEDRDRLRQRRRRRIAPALFRRLGCELVELFCEVDGRFPNHHPDPSRPENLQDVIRALRETDAELGLAFDGDGDRLGVVCKDGEIIYPDRQLMLFAEDVLCRACRAARSSTTSSAPQAGPVDPRARRPADDVEDRPCAAQGQAAGDRRRCSPAR
jgi:phosphomannomutase/phosphoglucomutase